MTLSICPWYYGHLSSIYFCFYPTEFASRHLVSDNSHVLSVPDKYKTAPASDDFFNTCHLPLTKPNTEYEYLNRKRFEYWRKLPGVILGVRKSTCRHGNPSGAKTHLYATTDWYWMCSCGQFVLESGKGVEIVTDQWHIEASVKHD